MITVLLAEDNDSVASSIRRYLEHTNFAVLHVRDGESAIQTSKEQLPDIIVMDIRMPGLSGLEAIKHIRATPEIANIPIIATTGLAAPSDSARCLDAGAHLYISKPYRMQRLVEHIMELCDTPSENPP